MKTINFLKSVKNTLPATMRVFVLIFSLALSFWVGTTNAQIPHDYLDNMNPGDTTHHCITVPGAWVHRPANSGSSFQYWIYGGNQYNGDSILVPNTYSGGITCVMLGGNKTIRIEFDPILIDPGLINQTLCGSTPVDLNSGNPGANHLWSTGATTQSITTNVTGIYWVDVFNACGLIRDSANMIFIAAVPKIDVVTFEPITQRNMLMWTSNLQWRKVYIYKKNPSDVMVLIDSTNASDNQYIDMGSNPPSDQAEYAIAVRDTCDNLSDTSAHHRTVWLQISSYGTDVYFHYTKYVGVPVSTYTLKGINSLGQVDSLKAVAASFADFSIPISVAQNYSKFFLDFPVTIGSKSILHVRSNTVTSTVGIEAYLSSLIKLYPNPVSNILHLDVTGELKISDLKIYNISGDLVYSSESNKLIYVNTFADGIYYINITTSDGFFIHRKIVVIKY